MLKAPSTPTCGDWRIGGSRGHAYAVPEGYQFFVFCRSSQHWTWTRSELRFMRVTQDGDNEGGLILVMDGNSSGDRLQPGKAKLAA